MVYIATRQYDSPMHFITTYKEVSEKIPIRLRETRTPAKPLKVSERASSFARKASFVAVQPVLFFSASPKNFLHTAFLVLTLPVPLPPTSWRPREKEYLTCRYICTFPLHVSPQWIPSKRPHLMICSWPRCTSTYYYRPPRRHRGLTGVAFVSQHALDRAHDKPHVQLRMNKGHRTSPPYTGASSSSSKPEGPLPAIQMYCRNIR